MLGEIEGSDERQDVGAQGLDGFGAELGAVDLDVADLGVLERLAFGSGVLVSGQAGDAVTLEAAVERAAGELGD